MDIVKGDSKDFYVIVKDGDGVVFDLTDYTMTFTARVSYASTEIAITCEANISAPATGRGDFEIPKADTDILKGAYVYDVQIDSTTKRYTVIRLGELNILDGVTQI